MRARRQNGDRAIVADSGCIRCRAELCRLRSDGPETQNGKAEKQATDQRDSEELRPDHIDARTAKEDRLRKRHEMR